MAERQIKNNNNNLKGRLFLPDNHQNGETNATIKATNEQENCKNVTKEQIT